MRRFTILVCPDSFKETLAADSVAKLISEELNMKGGFHTVCLPLADGGEGTLDALCQPTDLRAMDVTGPLGERISAVYGLLPQKNSVVIEMARASGLGLIPPEKRDVLRATTLGTGQLMRSALDENPRQMIICIGGSATNDGGAGALQALGARFLDAAGNDLGPGGAELLRLQTVDFSAIDPRLGCVEIRVAADVTNPLCGPEGASWTFGPQKGASADDCRMLDEALLHYGRMLEEATGRDIINVAGSGAAGGLAAGLLALGAEMTPGFEVVARAVGLEERMRDADAVVTGEGKLDKTSLQGKTVGGVLQLCNKLQKPCYVVCGVSVLDARDDPPSLAQVYQAAGSPPTQNDLKNAESNLRKAALSLASDLVLMYPPAG